MKRAREMEQQIPCNFNEFLRNDVFPLIPKAKYEQLKQFKVTKEEDIEKSIDLINFLHKGHLQIKKSTIPNTDMWGLFADRDFELEEKITTYGGYKVIGADIYDYEENTLEKTAYFLDLQGNNDINIDGRLFYTLDDLARFANGVPWTTKQNNIQNNVRFHKRKGQITLKPIVPIKKGEEIFIVYGQDYGWDVFYPMEQVRQWFPHKKFKPQLLHPYKYNPKDEDAVEQMIYSLGSRFGTLKLLEEYTSISHRLWEPLLEHYLIKNEQDHENSLKWKLLYQHYFPDYHVYLHQTTQKIYAEHGIPKGGYVCSIGGILTDQLVFCGSIRLLNDWYLYPYKLYKLYSLGNTATMSENKGNVFIHIDSKFVTELHALRDIKKGEEIIIHTGAIPDCMECQTKKAKVFIEGKPELFFCGEGCYEKNKTKLLLT